MPRANGTLFRSGEALERLAEIAAVRFDKTGTLTTGSATISQLVVECPAEFDATLMRAASLAAASSHAMSQAIRRVRRLAQIAAHDDYLEVRVVPGLGVTGTLVNAKKRIVLGSRRFITEQGILLGPGISAAVADAESRGLPVTLVGWDGQARGLFVFDETWRHAAFDVIRWLKGAGLDVAILTGDHAARGAVIARAARRRRRRRATARSKGRRDRAGSPGARSGLHDRRRPQRRARPVGQ